jgi:hypothetical protein
LYDCFGIPLNSIEILDNLPSSLQILNIYANRITRIADPPRRSIFPPIGQKTSSPSLPPDDMSINGVTSNSTMVPLGSGNHPTIDSSSSPGSPPMGRLSYSPTSGSPASSMHTGGNNRARRLRSDSTSSIGLGNIGGGSGSGSNPDRSFAPAAASGGSNGGNSSGSDSSSRHRGTSPSGGSNSNRSNTSYQSHKPIRRSLSRDSTVHSGRLDSYTHMVSHGGRAAVTRSTLTPIASAATTARDALPRAIADTDIPHVKPLAMGLTTDFDDGEELVEGRIPGWQPPKLLHLGIGFNSLSDCNGLIQFAPSLMSLDLSSNHLCSLADTIRVLSTMPNLTNLYLQVPKSWDSLSPTTY